MLCNAAMMELEVQEQEAEVGRTPEPFTAGPRWIGNCDPADNLFANIQGSDK